VSPLKISIHPNLLDTACIERADQLGIQRIANRALDELGRVVTEHAQYGDDEATAEDGNAQNRNAISSTGTRA